MSSRAKGNGKPATSPDLGETVLTELYESAKGTITPANETDQEAYPALFSLLAPRVVTLPPVEGSKNERKAIREPLLTLSWDRAGGQWRWAVTDKLLNRRIAGTALVLHDVLQWIEKQLQEKTVAVKVIKPEKD